MATYSVKVHVDTWTKSMTITHQTFTKKCTFACLRLLPSPDSEGFVGEGEGRFPLGGLSDTPDSLDETRKNKKPLNCK